MQKPMRIYVFMDAEHIVLKTNATLKRDQLRIPQNHASIRLYQCH